VTINAPALSSIVELRQYTLHPDERDVLIDLFDSAFIESQEVLGMRVIGQFRDVDDPDRFVWLRGFSDMTSRADSLQAFYGGPVWKANRDVANATMIDSDNVLLLHPAHPGSGFAPDARLRPPPGTGGAGDGMVVVTVYPLDAPAGSGTSDYFERTLAPLLRSAGAAVLGSFVTEESANTFPALPIRENENVFVWLAGFHDAKTALALSVPDSEIPGASGSPQRLRLTPTARSLLTGSSRPCSAT
jgi:hypothetical protein